MLVFHRRIRCPRAVCSTGDDHRNLAGKIDKAFEDADVAAHPLPGIFDFEVRWSR